MQVQTILSRNAVCKIAQSINYIEDACAKLTLLATK